MIKVIPLLIASSIFAQPVFFQPPIAQVFKVQAGKPICSKTIFNTVQTLQNVPRTKNVRFKTSDVRGYANVPAGKTKFYQFVFQGSGSDDILNSPKMMETLAARVLLACNESAVLTFNLDRSDAFEMYGWLNGKPQRFTCYPSTDKLPAKMPWGQRICL
ncbi:MAG: hypothetical protein LH631_07235 [Alkalinema sp. CAN_BIN05]|nr:hypothetical protein [Alkalinema sp. CAN_BIN05]